MNSEDIEYSASYAEESDDEEDMTVEQMLQALENAWLNEKFAPELLPHKIDIVEMALQQIKHMEENLKLVERDDIRKNIHTMEICRIRFIVSSYLRKRLEKIEEFAIHLLEIEAQKSVSEDSVMTSEEIQFAREYLSHLETLFNTVTLQHLPSKFSDLKHNEIVTKPNMDKHVFVRANKDIRGILIADEEEVDFDENSQHIVKYSDIATFVKNGDVQLI